MNLAVMNFNRIRDQISNLGWLGDDQSYVPGPDCLGTLEKLEDELLNEDPLKRNVRIGLYISGAVKKNLIPIIKCVKDQKIVATATRVLVNLSLPIEYLLSHEQSPDLLLKQNGIKKQLTMSSLGIKKAFLDVSATASLVSTLRDSMINSERHSIPLKEEDCNHLKNCLLLLRNILYLPDYENVVDETTPQMFHDWHSVQSKLIWNLFVQGIDGALILMLNSKYKAHWTVPLALIIALLYRNQNVAKIHQALDTISSSSDTSDNENDEESDGSKVSSTSLSSEASKNVEMQSDSGCALTSETPVYYMNERSNARQQKEETSKSGFVADIHFKLEKVQISDNGDDNFHGKHPRSEEDRENKTKMVSGHGNDCEKSSSCGSPCHKKLKGNVSSSDDIVSEKINCTTKTDSAISMDRSSSDIITKSSDDDNFDKTKPAKNLIAVQKLRSLQMNLKNPESDSSNGETRTKKIKYRSHPPIGRRGKSPRRNNGCIPSVCIISAYEASYSKGRVRFPLWKKRNSVSTLVDINSLTPSEEDLGNLLKEFTLTFMHSGFSQLVIDLKNLLLVGQSHSIDKSLLFWLISYFLHLAAISNICLDHISDILSFEVISFLVFECANACENLELHAYHDENILRYVTVHLDLLVLALKEVMRTLNIYSRKSVSAKDRVFLNQLNGQLAGFQDLRNIPLLLLRCHVKADAVRYLEDVIILNHEILVVVGRGSEKCSEVNKINFLTHLKMFSTPKIVACYGKVLDNFKFNGHFLNECLLTMLHHIAGDVRSPELLLQPSILKIFSEIMKEELELEQYQEDLIMYTLNRFTLQVYQKDLKVKAKAKGIVESKVSYESSSNSGVSSNCLLFEEEDDLFWWYLQFEQDKDPISRISEHITTPKRDILTKLHLKGHISDEKYKQLEQKMEAVKDNTQQALSTGELAQISNFDDDITHLLRSLVQTGHRQHLMWLQETLLEVCFVKLGLNTHLPESVPYYSLKLMLSAPLIPYTEEQQNILQDQVFLQLLTKLGLQLSTGMYQMYPRIPIFWTAEELFNIASRLGPVKKEKLKFTHEELIRSITNEGASMSPNSDCFALPPLSSCFTLSAWLTAVEQNKEIYREAGRSNLIFK